MAGYKLEELLSGITDENRREEFPIGEYFADYSPLTAAEIAMDEPALTELYANSVPTPLETRGNSGGREANITEGLLSPEGREP